MTETAVPFGRRIRNLAESGPSQAAVVFVAADGSERPLTWGELDARSSQIGRVMAARGVGVGDRVGLELRNSPELVLCILATWKLGAAPVPIRWDLPAWERHRLLEVVDGRLVIGPDDLALVEQSRSQPAAPLPDVLGPRISGTCSSGSTGSPKVIMTERPAVWDPEATEPFPTAWGPTAWGPIARPQVILVPAPMYHTNGFATMLSLLNGDRLVLLERFDAARAIDLIERHRVTTFTATPTMLGRMARLPGVGRRDLSSLVWVLQGAAGIAPSLVEAWIDLIGAEHLYMAYGMTEALGLAAIRGDEWLAHRGSVGRGFRQTELRILGPDGADLPPGEIGEIYLRWPSSGTYTYRGGAPLLPSTDDGFGTAGDLGWLDEDGYLYVADRRVDLIISGGANVFPAEVEAALADHPAIADVVVVGLIDEEWGRRVHAIVEPADPAAPPSADEVIAYARQRLAPYKVPKTVEVVDAVPRSEATKVSRSALVAARGG